MITVENYKAFHGVMRITPKSKCVPPLEIEGDWLYNPEYKCWYGNGASYTANLCTVVRDDSEKQIPKKPLNKSAEYDGEYGNCPCCNTILADYSDHERCLDCGQALDWSDVQ